MYSCQKNNYAKATNKYLKMLSKNIWVNHLSFHFTRHRVQACVKSHEHINMFNFHDIIPNWSLWLLYKNNLPANVLYKFISSWSLSSNKIVIIIFWPWVEWKILRIFYINLMRCRSICFNLYLPYSCVRTQKNVKFIRSKRV